MKLHYQISAGHELKTLCGISVSALEVWIYQRSLRGLTCQTCKTIFVVLGAKTQAARQYIEANNQG